MKALIKILLISIYTFMIGSCGINDVPSINGCDWRNQGAAYSSCSDLLWSPVGDSIIYWNFLIKTILFIDSINAWTYWFDNEKSGLYSKSASLNDTSHIIYKGDIIGTLDDWSKDGEWIISLKNGIFSKMHPDGSGQVVLFNSPRQHMFISRLSFSYDGTKIVYSDAGKIYIINSDGSNKHYICEGTWPHWTRNGRLIDYKAIPNPDHYYYALRFIDTLTLKIDTIAILYYISTFKPSPDGKYIAYRSMSGLNLFNLSDRTDTMLEGETAIDDWYDWSNKSDQIVYIRYSLCDYTKNNGQLWLLKLDGSKRQLTFPTE